MATTVELPENVARAVAAASCHVCRSMADRLTWEYGRTKTTADEEVRSWCDEHRDLR